MNKKQTKKKRTKSQKTSTKVNLEPTKRNSNLRLLNSFYQILLFFIFLFIYMTVFDYKLDLNGDNAGYYTLGKAVSQGKGYVNIQSINLIPANHFPPGYPAIIAVIMTLFSDSIETLKIGNGVLFFLSVLILFEVFKKLNSDIHLAFVGSLFVLVNGHLLRYSTIVMSEIPFLFFSTLAIYLFIRLDKNKHPLKNPLFYLVLMCLVFSYHIRTAGISLFGGIMLYLLFHKNWKYLIATLVGFTALALPWFIRGQMLGGSSYQRQLMMVNPYRPELGKVGFSDLVTRFVNNLSRYITKEIPDGCLTFFKANYQKTVLLDWVIGLLILLLIGYGVYKVRNYKLLIISYFIGTFFILLLWPSVWFGTRFLLPTIPLLVFCLFNGIYELLCFLFSKYKMVKNPHPLFLLIFIFLFIPKINELKAQAKSKYPPNWENYFATARWVKNNTNKDVVVCCRKPVMFYLFADRHTTGYKNTLDDQELIESLIKNNVAFVVLEQLGFGSTYRYLYPAIKKNPELFPAVFHLKNPDTYLLKFNPES